MQQETLAEFVARTMRDKNISGYDIERRTHKGISQSYSNRIKNGEITNPTPDKLKHLAKGLGVSEDELFRIARGASAEPTEFDKQLLFAASDSENWTDEQKEYFLRTVRTVAAGIRNEKTNEPPDK